MSQKNKIVGLDMDGVVIDHYQNKIRLAKSLGFELKPEQTSPEMMREVMAEPLHSRLQLVLYYDSEVSLQSPVTRGLRKFLSEIKNKHPYYLISRRESPESAIKILRHKKLWPEFFNDKNTFFVEKMEDKNTICKKVGVTHYVDDDTRVLEKLSYVKNRFLFDSRGLLPKTTGFHKIKSWEEFSELIK